MCDMRVYRVAYPGTYGTGTGSQSFENKFFPFCSLVESQIAVSERTCIFLLNGSNDTVILVHCTLVLVVLGYSVVVVVRYL
jgi:hypothetical protein